MASNPVGSFNRALRAWVEQTTGKAIGAVDTTRFPRSSVYRQTSGNNLVSANDLRDLVAICIPKDLTREDERKEWFAAEFKPLHTHWKEAAAYRADSADRDDPASSGGGGSDGAGLATALAMPPGMRENSSELAHSLELLAAKVAEVETAIPQSRQPGMLTREVGSALAELTEFVEHAIHGQIVRGGTDLRDLISQTRACAAHIRATTTITTAAIQSGQSWWDAPGAQAYLEENKLAIARGVEIHRIFIVDVFDEATQEFIRSQAELGVRASWALASSLAVPYRTNVLVWDGKIGWKSLMATTGEVSENWLYTSEGDIRRLLAVYEACRENANPV